MARQATRVARSDRGLDERGDPKLGFDEALVGGSADDAAEIEIDPSEVDRNPYVGSEDDDSWDLPEDKRNRETPRHRDDGDGGGEGRARQREQREEGDQEEDLRLAYDEGDGEERSGRRSRRNRGRRRAIDTRDQHIATLQNELQQTKEMVQNLMGGQYNLSARDIDQRIQFHQNAIDAADREIAKAIKESDGDTAVALQRERDKINYDLWRLQGAKQNMEEGVRRMQEGGQVDPRQPQLTPQQQQMLAAQDAEFTRMKDVFLDRYTWFDEQGDDPDHDFVRNLDQRLVRDGYQRHTKAFWHEMERRMQSAGFEPDGRQERFDDDDDDRGFQSRRNGGFQSRRLNGGGSSGGGGGAGRRYNGPPTGVVRSVQRSGRDGGDGGFQLSDIQVDMLREEDLLRNDLTKEEQAKKDRIMNKWRAGSEALARSRR